MNSGSSEMGRKVKKNITTRRSWTQKEEEVLLAAVKELVVTRQKTPNGFRSGYLHTLEKAMKKEFPHTDLKGHPHITSKLASWKRNYGSLCGILSRSGIGWNNTGNYMIDCDNDQWEQICKLDSNARTMRYKSWPLFEDWKEIFGSDRATGETAEDIKHAYYEMLTEGNLGFDGTNGDYNVEFDHLNVNEEEAESVSQSQKPNAAVSQNNGDETSSQSHKSNSVPNQKSKKRKAKEELTGVCDVIERIGAATNERLEHLANRIGYDFDLGKARQEAFNQLGNIPGLSIDDKFDICIKLAREVELLEVFMGLNDEAKSHFVMRLLKDKGS